MTAFYPSEEKRIKTLKLLHKVANNIGKYLLLKTGVSFLTGFLSFIALWIFGIEAPLFWALLIFVLNYIPTIGSLIATLFPAVFAMFQYGELGPFFYIIPHRRHDSSYYRQYRRTKGNEQFFEHKLTSRHTITYDMGCDMGSIRNDIKCAYHGDDDYWFLKKYLTYVF